LIDFPARGSSPARPPFSRHFLALTAFFERRRTALSISLRPPAIVCASEVFCRRFIFCCAFSSFPFDELPFRLPPLISPLATAS